MKKWFEMTETDRPNIVASRVRLVRNWKAYPFPSALEEKSQEELLRRLEFGLKDFGETDGRSYEYADLREISQLDCRALQERRILNSSIIEKKDRAGLMLSKDESVSLVLGSDDHIRLQLLSPGLHLDKLWREADKMDDYMNIRFPYAFDEKYGYLTSFPTNVGTGLRASALLHLPALSTGKRFQNLLGDMGRFGVNVRGVYGEGSENYGALYEISNQKTLGQTEQEIIALISKAANQLNRQENQVRAAVLQDNRLVKEDEVYKSYGVLRYARRLTRKDAMIFLSQMMEGACDGLLKFQEPCSIYRLMLGIQTANLQKLSDRPLSKEELDVARAEFIRRELPKLAE